MGVTKVITKILSVMWKPKEKNPSPQPLNRLMQNLLYDRFSLGGQFENLNIMDHMIWQPCWIEGKTLIKHLSNHWTNASETLDYPWGYTGDDQDVMSHGLVTTLDWTKTYLKKNNIYLLWNHWTDGCETFNQCFRSKHCCIKDRHSLGTGHNYSHFVSI